MVRCYNIMGVGLKKFYLLPPSPREKSQGIPILTLLGVCMKTVVKIWLKNCLQIYKDDPEF